MKKKGFLIALCCLCLTGLVWGADEPVKMTGERINGDNEKKWAHIEGNVRIVQGSTVIITEAVEVDTDKKIAYFNSDLKLTHPDATITASNLEYYFKKKYGTFRINVVMDRKEQKDSKGKVTKEAFHLTCDELYFENDTKNFNAKGKARIVHKDFTGVADQINYDDKKQEMVFINNAYLTKPSKEEIKGDSVKIDLKAKKFIVQKNVTIELKVDDDKETDDKGKDKK
jgi:lipopolysaccharide export system protein LptA